MLFGPLLGIGIGLEVRRQGGDQLWTRAPWRTEPGASGLLCDGLEPLNAKHRCDHGSQPAEAQSSQHWHHAGRHASGVAVASRAAGQ